MKTLFISDLDGTLLNNNAEITEFTKKTLNEVMKKGVNFSVATARTAATVLHMLEDVSINVPIVLMNGVAVYDITAKKYVKTHTIETASVEYMLQVLKRYEITGFLYTLENDQLHTYYEKIYSEHARRFIEERIVKYNKQFTYIDSFTLIPAQSVIYFSVCDKEDKLHSLYHELSKDKSLHIEFYRDIYEEELWYLEICSSFASKYNAVKFLREEFGFEKIVSFGDNLNDLPMFMASDECYAVANARMEVKEKATDIIGSNMDDSVARWLRERV